MEMTWNVYAVIIKKIDESDIDNYMRIFDHKS